MKNYLKLLTVLVFIGAIFFLACQSNNETKNPANSNAAPIADKQTYKSTGVVKAIDKTNGKITIDHEDIPGYMSEMEMNEAVSNPQMLETVKAGDKVEFEIERTGAKIVVTKLNKIGETTSVNGGEIYKANCAKCHGGNGEGADKGIPLITGHALHHSEQEYVEQVENGEGKKMPAFKDKLSAEEIAAVVKFVRENLQKDARQNEKPGETQHGQH